MHEIKKIVPKRKVIEVEDGTVEITTYISDDGKKKSTDKSEIFRYEAQERFNQIEHIQVDSDFIEENDWFRLKSEEEKDIFMNHYGFTDSNKYMEYLRFDYELVDYWDLKLPINEWFSIRYSDGGDHRSSYYIFTKDYFVNDLHKILDKIGVKING